MKTYDTDSLYDLDPGPWKLDPETWYWATESGLVAIPGYTTTHTFWDRWNNVSKQTLKYRKPKFLANGPTPKGYLRGHNHFIHRIVARAWIPNPDNKPQVNHKDGDKTNNAVYNLEWMNNSENVKHSYDIGLQPKRQRDELGRIKRVNF